MLSGDGVANEVEVLGGITISPYNRRYAIENAYGYTVHLFGTLEVYDVCNLNCTSTCPYDPENLAYVDDCPSGLISYIDPYKTPPIKSFQIPAEGLILEPGVFYMASLVEEIDSNKYDFYLENNLLISKYGVDAAVDTFPNLRFGMVATHPTKVYAGMDIGKVQFV